MCSRGPQGGCGSQAAQAPGLGGRRRRGQLALAFPLDLGARPLCRRLRGRLKSREPRVSFCDPRKTLRVLRRVLRPDSPTMTREQRPAPFSLSLGLGARSPGLSRRLALHPCGLSALLAWALAPSLGQKPRCGWGSFLGEGQSRPLGLPAQERVVFGSLAVLPVLNWISGPPLA